MRRRPPETQVENGGQCVLCRLTAAYQAGRLEFFADQAGLAEPARFKAYIAPLRKIEWVVYAKRPFGGPGAVLAYLSRYTHRTLLPTAGSSPSTASA